MVDIQKLLDRHAKHFVGPAEKNKGALEGIHFHENGSIYLTDGFKMLAINNAHNGSSRTLHFTTGKELAVDYPKVEQLLDQSYENTFLLEMKHVKSFIELLPVAGKAIDRVAEIKIVKEIGSLDLTVKNESAERYRQHLGFENGHADFRILVDIFFLYRILKFFIDTKVDYVEVKTKSHMSPMSISSGDYEALLLPIRRS